MRERSANSFENKYLNIGVSSKIKVYRIIDSKQEGFRISSHYRDKVEIINVITNPEIEILMILNENLNHDYSTKRKSKEKPSIYIEKHLKKENKLKKNESLKSKEFVTKYFSDSKILLSALKEHKKKYGNDHTTIYDLLKEEYK